MRIDKAKELRNKIISRNHLSSSLGLLIICVVISGLMAACGDNTATNQPASITTATTNPATATEGTTEALNTVVNTPTTLDTQAATSTFAPTVTTAADATVATTTTPVPATTIEPTTAQTTPAITKASNAPAPTTTPARQTTASSAKSSVSHIFSEADNNSTLQIKVGDTVLAKLDPSLDWNFEVISGANFLSGPLPANPPYEKSFKALSIGTAQIMASGSCHPVPGKVCFKAIITHKVTVMVR